MLWFCAVLCCVVHHAVMCLACCADVMAHNTAIAATPACRNTALPAGGAEGRSGIAALIKIVNAKPGKQAGGGAAAAGKSLQEGGGEGEDENESDSDAEDGEGQQAGPATSAGEQQARRGDALALGRRLGGGSGGGGGRARQQQLRPLLRPIICICNDLYAPALRPLRDVARVFVFRKPQVGAQRFKGGCLRVLASSCCAAFLLRQLSALRCLLAACR
jgi:chromosome transmission fidelity protein 18